MLPGRGIFIGRFLNIPIYIHVSWFFILALFAFNWTFYLREATSAGLAISFVAATVAALLAFVTLIAHEYGHALAARYFGIQTDSITLFLLGGVAQIKGESRNPKEEFVIAIAGPLVSVLCACIFGGLALLLYMMQLQPLYWHAVRMVALINVVFAVFNMIPGFPMDGGRVLRAIIWAISGNYLSSTRAAAFIGQGFAGLMVFLGIMLILSGTLTGLFLVLTGAFIFGLARMSIKQAELKVSFDHVRVRDLMRPVQVVVPADLSIRDVVREYVYRIHADRFPVVRGASLLGYISTDDIALLERDQWDRMRAEGFARPYRLSEVISPDQDLFSAMEKAHNSGRQEVPVFRGKQLVGFLFVTDLMSYMRARIGKA